MAKNVGSSTLLNTEVEINLPNLIETFFTSSLTNFGCSGSSCGERDIAIWDVGTLNSGQSKTITFGTQIDNSATVGNIIHTRMVGRTSNINISQPVAYRDMLIGTLANIGTEELELTDAFALSNYPNPFTGKTTFSFYLPQAESATLKVYDAKGLEIGEVFSENLSAGFFEYEWEAGNLPAGIYYYRLEAGGNYIGKKMMVK